MKTRAFLLISSIALLSCARERVPAPIAAPVEEVAAPEVKAPEPATVAKPAPVVGYVETDGEVPHDVALHVAKVEKNGVAHWGVRLSRFDHLVMIRDAERIVAGANEATIEVDRARAATLYWEATHGGSLITTRGVLRIDTDGDTHLGLAEQPSFHNEEERRRHGCHSLDDAFGGFTVICRVKGIASARNLFGDQGVTRAAGEGWTTFRFDLPAQGSSAAFALGYVDHGTGVVVRVEASQAAGEARPTLAVLSADREQPAVPMFRHRHPHRMPEPDLL